MSSKYRPPVPFPVTRSNATTVGPQITRVVTDDPGYEAKALAGVLDRGGDRLRIFRHSRSDHDFLSCEVHSRQGARWQFQCKEPVKYVPPEEFQGKCVDIDGVSFWSFEDITAEQREVLRDILRQGVR